MTTERPHPVGGLCPRPLDVTQYQRPDREALFIGEQARVFSPAGQREEKWEEAKNRIEWAGDDGEIQQKEAGEGQKKGEEGEEEAEKGEED